MRCPAVLEYFMEPNWPNLSGDIKPETGLTRCLLLAEHVGNHCALVRGKPVEWPVK